MGPLVIKERFRERAVGRCQRSRASGLPGWGQRPAAVPPTHPCRGPRRVPVPGWGRQRLNRSMG